jgi:hypothetical protein
LDGGEEQGDQDADDGDDDQELDERETANRGFLNRSFLAISFAPLPNWAEPPRGRARPTAGMTLWLLSPYIMAA